MDIHEASFLAHDNLGISLKDGSYSVVLPKADIYKVKYEDKYGRQLLVAGEPDKVIRTLKKAGYKVMVE